MHLEVLNAEDYPSAEVHALHLIAAAILTLTSEIKKGFENMANDFSHLTAGFDALASAIASVVADLQNPAINNNDQTTIDGLTAKLDAAVQALTAADSAFKAAETPAPTPAPAPAPASSGGTGAATSTGTPAPVTPAPVGAETTPTGATPAASGSTSTDVTP